MTELVPLRRNRDFLLYQSGGLLSTFGSGISGIAYPLLTLALTHSAAKTGYVGAVEFLPLVLLSAPAGVAADRFDRRRLMIAADIAGATALAVLGTAVLTGHATFWLVVVVAFVDTSAAVLYRSGSSGAMKAVVPTPQLADASSVTMARMSTVRLLAPPLGGALWDLSRGLPFLVDAVSYAFSTAALLLMRTPFQEERVPGARTPFREGFAYFWNIPFLRATTGMIAASNLVAVGAPIALIILANRQGVSGFAIGVFIAVQGVALLLGSTLSPLLRRRFPMRAILLSEFWMALDLRRLHRLSERLRARRLHLAARVLVPEHRLGDPGVLVHAHPGSAARTGHGRRDHAPSRVGAARAASRRAPAHPHLAAGRDRRARGTGGDRRDHRHAQRLDPEPA